MEFRLKTKQSGPKTEDWLEKLKRKEYFNQLHECGRKGLEALRAATPTDTGKTAASWTYTVEVSSGSTTIVWSNDSVTRDGTPIVIMLQYGHGTGTGGYVVGQDFINPAMASVFDDISDRVWKVVTER